MRTKLVARALAFVAIAATVAIAQTPEKPAPPGTQAPTAGQAPPAASAPSPPPNYEYDASGRRDPFVSLLDRGTSDPRQGQATKVRPEGIAGVAVDEVVVKGIVQSRGALMAMIGAPNGRTYSIRPGDRLFDGVVKAITPTAVILMQEVNDPLSLEKQREVRKPLRGEVK